MDGACVDAPPTCADNEHIVNGECVPIPPPLAIPDNVCDYSWLGERQESEWHGPGAFAIVTGYEEGRDGYDYRAWHYRPDRPHATVGLYLDQCTEALYGEIVDAGRNCSATYLRAKPKALRVSDEDWNYWLIDIDSCELIISAVSKETP